MPAPSQPRRHRRSPLRITVPTRNDPFLRSLVGAVGGPLGRHTEPGIIRPGFWRIERVLLVMVLIAGLLAVFSKTFCRLHGWGVDQVYTGMCYSDWTALYGARGFASDPFAPFTGSAGTPFEYPVLLSVVASLTSLLVPRSLPAGGQTLAYFDINTFFVVALWAVVVIAVAKSAGRRPWDAAIVAASPAMILAATINWDMWAVALLTLGLLALGREHPWLAGALIGLGAAVKLYPFLVLGALLVLALRTGRWGAFGRVLGGSVIAWAAVNLPFALVQPKLWATFYTFSGQRGAGNSSLWQAWDLSVGAAIPSLVLSSTTITVLGFGLFAASCVGILALGLLAPRPPRVASLAFLVVAAFVLFGKVYSPQFVLWLIPLAALAYPRWRALLTWQAVEVAHFAGIWMFLFMGTGRANPVGHFPTWLFVVLVLGHMVALAWVCALVIRSILRPETDPVRRVGMADPLGGLFEGADRFAPTPDRTPARAASPAASSDPALAIDPMPSTDPAPTQPS